MQEAFSYLLQSTKLGIDAFKYATENTSTTTAYPGNIRTCNESKEMFGFLTTELQVNTTFVMKTGSACGPMDDQILVRSSTVGTALNKRGMYERKTVCW